MPSFKLPKPFRKFSKPFCSQTNSYVNNVGPLASLLDSRSVIRFRGPDTVKFLQGLLTNDVRKFGEPVGERTSSLPSPNVSSVSIPPIYAAMLNPQGRFLYDFFIYRPSRPDEKFDGSGSRPGSDPGEMELFADVDASVTDEIVDTLKKYRLRSKVDIEYVDKEFSCWQRYGCDISNNCTSSSSSLEEEVNSVGYGGGVDAPGVSASRGNDRGWQWYKDPRLDCLGFRGIFPSNTIPPLVEADKETDEKNFTVWRVERGVAEGSTEIPKGEAIPLEYNFSGLNAISFDKGCYVGQELIARAHHRGVIRKRLFPLKFFDDTGKDSGQSVGPGTEVIANGTGKKIGTINIAIGARGLGVLRLEDAFKSRDELSIKGQDVKVEVIRPHWWPSEWDMEYTQS